MSSKYKPPKPIGWVDEKKRTEGVLAMWGDVTAFNIEANVQSARINSPYLSTSERAVTVAFVRRGRDVSLSMDKYETPAENLAALRLCIDDMRMIERRGMDETMQSAYMQLAAPATERDPYEVLGLRPGASKDDIEAMYRLRAKSAHPDAGGTDEAMSVLNSARDRALAAVAA